MKDYKEMIKSELIAEIEKKGLSGEVEGELTKATNAILLEVLEKSVSAEVIPEKVPSKGRPMGVIDHIKRMNTSYAYIIVDHDKSYDIKDDDENRTFEFGWGNKITSWTNERIILSSEEQLVTNGGIKALRAMTIPHVKINDKTGQVTHLPPKPRFSITKTQGLSEKEFTAFKAKL